MTGQVKYLRWIERHMLRAEPDARFVFGDNTRRLGMGGQAGAMRGEPNAIGIATKWAPGWHDSDFFHNADPGAFAAVETDLSKVRAAIDEGRTIYVPFDGLGTGLSELPTRAPAVLNHIVAFFSTLPGEACPWRAVTTAE